MSDNGFNEAIEQLHTKDTLDEIPESAAMGGLSFIITNDEYLRVTAGASWAASIIRLS